MSRFTRRPYFSVTGALYSQRTPALMVSVDSRPEIVVGVQVVGPLAEILVGVAEGDGSRVRDAQQEIGEIETGPEYRIPAGEFLGGRAVEADRPRGFCCERLLNSSRRKSPPKVKLCGLRIHMTFPLRAWV